MAVRTRELSQLATNDMIRRQFDWIAEQYERMAAEKERRRNLGRP